MKLLLASLLAFTLPQSGVDESGALDAGEAQSILSCIETLGGLDASAVESCLETLRELGDPALEIVLAQYRDLPRLAKRRVAQLLADRGGSLLVERSRPFAADSDPAVRRLVLQYLGATRHGDDLLGERIAALRARAIDDPDPELRQEALSRLGALEVEPAFVELDRLLEVLPQAERRWIAALLGTSDGARPIIERRVRQEFTRGDSERTVGDEVLALFLPSYGVALAERIDGGATAKDRAPLILGRAHASASVRRGALRAFERFLTRLRGLGQTERALRLLDRFAEDGLDRRIAADQRAQIALFEGDDPQVALQAARSLLALADPLGGPAERAVLARGAYLEGLAGAAAGDFRAADESLRRAAQLLDGLIAERSDLWSQDSFEAQTDHLQLRAAIELCLAALEIAGGKSAADDDVVERARRLHRLSLEAQLVETRGGRGADRSLDAVLQDPLSPYSLLFSNRRWPEWPVERAIRTQMALGDALAAVCPREMPGFQARAQNALGPLEDPERLGILIAIQEAQMAALDDMIGELADRRDDPVVAAQILRLQRIKLTMWQEIRDGDASGSSDYLLENRSASQLPLWLIGDLRTEGRTTESRELALRTRTGLEKSGEYHRSAMFAAEIEMAIGSSWSDEDQPERAEKELLTAVERLEGLEATLEERGADPRQIARVELVRSSALVSLAVNANVKLQDVDKALEYFEAAYELRRDDFMTVLLACYRARSGKPEEAREALASVIPSPNVYYNLACTYALLGDANRALDFLRRELDENHPSAGSLERQKEWARRDPDLEFLRDDPRFSRLVGKDE